MGQSSDNTRPSLTVLAGELGRPGPAPDGPGGGGDGFRAGPPAGEIFEGAPAIALGVDGKNFFYLNTLHQLIDVNNHTKDVIASIFGGREDLLVNQFPSYGKNGAITGWSQGDARGAMMRACCAKGVWNAYERVRGPGAWPDTDGGVILHCGQAILYRGRWLSPGEIDGFVYPAAMPTPRPLQAAIDAEASPALELLEMLTTWRWMRGDVDAYLLLGWICAAMFGGALKWRPLVWITGDAGTGKSTLQDVIKWTFGQSAIIHATDTTEAGLRQHVANATLPVALDEQEADVSNDKIMGIVKLARQAASGGVVLRGGADHKGHEFTARSCFAFSSILVPPMLDQDISRMALLELIPFSGTDTAPAVSEAHLGRIGQGMRTRILDGWSRLHKTLEIYRQALARAGHSARGADQFGTLLAMADLALHDALPDQARADAWADKIDAASIDNQMDRSADWQRMLVHLFGQIIDPWRSGAKRTVGEYIEIAAGLGRNPDEVDQAAKILALFGLRVRGVREDASLMVANSHPSLQVLFEQTRWNSGVHGQAVKRVPHAKNSSTRFNRVGFRVWEFPLRSIPGYFDQGDPLHVPERSAMTPQGGDLPTEFR